ncbi:MAG: EAL domain-containing protein [Cyanobacteria bacterium SBLK]|nr:EAL domain-containing protein [Cyanobacteria bacterium SBLK]
MTLKNIPANNNANKPSAKILVVDDEQLLQYIIQQRFRHQIRAKEYIFDYAPNGVIAIEKLQTDGTFDMVLTDINMPEMDGLTLLNKIMEIDLTLKAVVMSAYGDMENIRTAMNRGAFDFLIKPIDLDDLEITITKTLAFIEQTRARQQELDTARERLKHQAFYDSLTGLPNQILFLDRIRQCLSREQKFAILSLDVERYRLIKSSLGRTIGEQLLVEMVERVRHCMPSNATLARTGSDEFAILLDRVCNEKDIHLIAESIHQSLSTPFAIEGEIVSSTTRIGIASSDADCEQAEDYLQAADTAMESAKKKGMGSTAFFDRQMHSVAIKQLQLEADLARAISSDELILHYQPIVSLASEKIVGFEALVRWQHPIRGLILPGEFISVAEKTGLIVPLGKWVLARAIRHLSRWRSQFPHFSDLTVSVNVSGLQLFTPDFVEILENLLQQDNVQGDILKLEITESVLIDNAEAAKMVFQQLKQQNIQLCLDDFGTGYSSLAYLHNLPIDMLKIDRSFINSMLASQRNLRLVNAILNLTESLGLQAVAEGVETSEQVQKLRELNCQFAQGYFFDRALPSHEILPLLEREAMVIEN